MAQVEYSASTGSRRWRQLPLFPEYASEGPSPIARLGEQADIRYFELRAGSVLNNPESTGMGYWSVNPYTGCAFGCGYCFARFSHRYVAERGKAGGRFDAETASDLGSMPPWLAFERRIFVKTNAPAVLRRALRHGGARHLGLVQGETLVIGTATDPYQPAERRFRVTRGILEVLAEHSGLSIVIITKSPLITRDIDLLVRLGRHSKVCVHLSLITLDRELARRVEPRSPTPESRIRALERLRAAGIDAGINCMPVLPGITDHPAALEALVRRVAEAGATYVGTNALLLRATARNRYLPMIAEEFPELEGSYRRAYSSGHELPEQYRRKLYSYMELLCERYGVRSSSREGDNT
jgi:DNA repair photolyase